MDKKINIRIKTSNMYKINKKCIRRFFMYKYLKIVNVVGREVLDSRGNPTVEAEVTVKVDVKSG